MAEGLRGDFQTIPDMAFIRWNYGTAFLRCALLLVAGTTLQLTAGGIDGGFLRHPWGIVLAVNYLYLLILAYSYSDRYRWLRTLWDDRACISSLVTLLLLVMVFGLVRQDGAEEGLSGVLGLSRMRSAWAFNIILLYFMTVLGIRAVSDVTALFRSVRSRADGEAPSEYSRVFRRIAVTVIHTAVFLVLLAGMFGAGDRVRCRLTAHQGVPEGMALTDDGRVVGLPFSVVLRKFSIDEYPPRLYVRDMHVGEDSEEFLSVEEEGASASFEGWTFSADTVLDMAGRLPSETVYRAMEHVGAVPAVHVTAVSGLTGETRSGWVSCGSHIFAASSLDLGGGKVLVMPYPQARRYLSEVTVTVDGKATDMDIGVNHPGKVGSWRIYQSGYDTSKGKWSTVSILECVRDPWYGAVHVALWLILAAGAVMSAAAVSRRRRSGDSGRAVPCGDSGKGKEGGS